MKKNRMMRLASILLVCVLLSTSVISGTFAKYITTGTATDSAQVAKWGVTIATDTDNYFADSYAKADENYEGTNSVAIVTGATYELVAPGTSVPTVTNVVVSGTPEVATRVTYAATITLAGWKLADADDAEEYCPIIFTVEGVQYKIGTEENTDTIKYSANVSALITAVENAIEGCAKDYAPGAAIANGTDAPTIGWEWPFEVDNGKDTILGNRANEGKAATISITVVATAEQID